MSTFKYRVIVALHYCVRHVEASLPVADTLTATIVRCIQILQLNRISIAAHGDCAYAFIITILHFIYSEYVYRYTGRVYLLRRTHAHCTQRVSKRFFKIFFFFTRIIIIYTLHVLDSRDFFSVFFESVCITLITIRNGARARSRRHSQTKDHRHDNITPSGQSSFHLDTDSPTRVLPRG